MKIISENPVIAIEEHNHFNIMNCEISTQTYDKIKIKSDKENLWMSDVANQLLNHKLNKTIISFIAQKFNHDELNDKRYHDGKVILIGFFYDKNEENQLIQKLSTRKDGL